MTSRLTSVRGLARRLRLPDERPRGAARTLDLSSADLERVIPFHVRIEIAAGRSSTASAMRAAHVQHRLENVGAVAWTIALEGSHATVQAELDPDQLEHAATLPFVRRISLS